MKKVMILGAGPLQVPAIKKAKELGFHVIVCDYNPNAVGMKFADKPLLVSTIEQDAVLAQARLIKPDYVITSTSDIPVRIAAFVSEKMGIYTGISYEDAICATNKDAMRKRFLENNVSIPEFYSCYNYQDFVDAVAKFDECCIVKPADSAASRGVELFYTDRNKCLKSQYENTLSFSKSGVVMVEEFMKGPEVSVEVIVENGNLDIIAITDKQVSELPYFVELGHSEQSQLPDNSIEDIKKVAIDAVKAINIVNGSSHVELKLTQDGPKVVETAARLGGDFITSHLVPLATGVNIVDNSLRLAFQQEIDLKRRWDKGSAVRFLSSKTGTIKDIILNGDPSRVEGVKEFSIYKRIGEKTSDLRSSDDRIGHIITQADTAKEAIVIAEEVINKIQIILE